MFGNRGAAEKDGQEGCKKCHNKEHGTDPDADDHVVDTIPVHQDHELSSTQKAEEHLRV